MLGGCVLVVVVTVGVGVLSTVVLEEEEGTSGVTGSVGDMDVVTVVDDDDVDEDDDVGVGPEIIEDKKQINMMFIKIISQ